MEGHEPKHSNTDAATAENLKRLAKMLSNGTPVNLKLNGRRVTLPADADLSIDLARDPETGCAEVDIRWTTGSLSALPHSRVSGGTAPRSRAIKEPEAKKPAPHIRLKAIVAAPRI